MIFSILVIALLPSFAFADDSGDFGSNQIEGENCGLNGCYDEECTDEDLIE